MRRRAEWMGPNTGGWTAPEPFCPSRGPTYPAHVSSNGKSAPLAPQRRRWSRVYVAAAAFGVVPASPPVRTADVPLTSAHKHLPKPGQVSGTPGFSPFSANSSPSPSLSRPTSRAHRRQRHAPPFCWLFCYFPPLYGVLLLAELVFFIGAIYFMLALSPGLGRGASSGGQRTLVGSDIDEIAPASEVQLPRLASPLQAGRLRCLHPRASHSPRRLTSSNLGVRPPHPSVAHQQRRSNEAPSPYRHVSPSCPPRLCRPIPTLDPSSINQKT